MPRPTAVTPSVDLHHAGLVGQAGQHLSSTGICCIVPVRTCDLACAPFSGRDWVMVTMDAPAAEMPGQQPCSAPVLSSSVATTVMDSRPVSASNTVSLYL